MTENELKNLLAAVTPPDEAARRGPRPLGCVGKAFGRAGRLETMVEDAAALTGKPVPDVSRRAVLVLCADNGVVAQGVSQTDASVTRAVLEKLTARRTSVCRMAAAAHCDVVPVDMGIAGAPVPGAADCRIAAGTADFTGPAMTAHAVQAIEPRASRWCARRSRTVHSCWRRGRWASATQRRPAPWPVCCWAALWPR